LVLVDIVGEAVMAAFVEASVGPVLLDRLGIGSSLHGLHDTPITPDARTELPRTSRRSRPHGGRSRPARSTHGSPGRREGNQGERTAGLAPRSEPRPIAGWPRPGRGRRHAAGRRAWARR